MKSIKYQIDSENVFVPTDGVADFSYSDGSEIEDRILRHIKNAKDISLASDELQSKIQDWPSEYHFSPLRPNLLSFINLKQFNHVLEVGSGCGAITRLLGEKGNSILALEGSYQRAKITDARCGDLNNVDVYCDSFKRFQSDKPFDLVTMIGVLEYSPSFFPGENPVHQALSKAYDLLDETGVLVIAIENQLGLKYFNGCVEDHSGELFFGINNLYKPETYVTYGKKEISQQLEKAGFHHLEYVYPFPDYKLPRLLVRENCLENNSVLSAGNMIGQYLNREHSQNNERFLLDNRVWPILVKNGLAADLANSFLIFAFKNDKGIDDFTEDWLIRSFCGSRKKQYLVENRFHKKDDSVMVDKSLIYPTHKDLSEPTLFIRHQLETSGFIPGNQYSNQTPAILLTENPFEAYIQYLIPWIQFLKDKIIPNQSDELIDHLLPGEYLDCRPDNIIIKTNGELEYFDKEWFYTQPLSFGFVVFRSIFHDIQSNIFWYRKVDLFGDETVEQWLHQLFSHLELNINIAKYIETEISLQAEITGNSHEKLRHVMTGFLSSKHRRTSSLAELLNSDDKLQSIAKLNSSIHELNTKLFELEKRNQSLLNEVRQVTSIVHHIWAGWSWKIFRFLTYIPRKVKQNVLFFLRLIRSYKRGIHQVDSKISFSEWARQAPTLFFLMFRNWLIKREFSSMDYLFQHWIQCFNKPAERDLVNNTLNHFKTKPLLSIVLPVYNTPSKWLNNAIGSVIKQSYSNWELCIADDASTIPSIRKILDDYQQSDTRIKVTYRSENGHISESSNTALEMANGEFTLLLDHDDELHPDALFSIAQALNQQPTLDFIYSDEDKIDERGYQFAPCFKPDWNPELLYSYNYICHLAVYRTHLLKEIGGFRKGFEGAQDWDLILRYTEHTDPSRILHIPKILYHWRTIEGSTALDLSSAKPYAVKAGAKVLHSALERNNIEADVVESYYAGIFRIKPKLAKQPLVSIIITVNQPETIYKNLEALIQTTEYQLIELILVVTDHVNENELRNILPAHISTKIIKAQDGKSRASILNSAAKVVNGDFILFLQENISHINNNWLAEMVAQATREQVGVVGAKLLDKEGCIVHAGIIIGIKKSAGSVNHGLADSEPGLWARANVIQNFSSVSTACFLVKKSLFDETHGFDEALYPQSLYGADFCLRAQKEGQRVVYTPHAKLICEVPEDNVPSISEIETIKENWPEVWLNDPHFNPNLSLERDDFFISFKPRV